MFGFSDIDLAGISVFHIIRTESECCKQAIWLVVNEMTSENCERPQRALQRLSAHVSDDIACPLRRYFQSVDSPSIQWYKVENAFFISAREALKSCYYLLSPKVVPNIFLKIHFTIALIDMTSPSVRITLGANFKIKVLNCI